MLHLRTGPEFGTTGAPPAWSPARDLRIVHPAITAGGMASRQVEVMWQLDAGGTWQIAWVPPIRELSIWFSSSRIEAGDQFDVLLTVPFGTPEGAEIYVEDSFGNSTTFHPARGSEELVWPGRSYPQAGAVLFTVRCITAGGNTAFTQLLGVRLSGELSLTASLDPVAALTPFDVSLVLPAAAIAGDTVEFVSTAGNLGTVTQAGGETIATLAGQVISSGGDIGWTATVKRGGAVIGDAAMVQQVIPQVVLAASPVPVEAGRPYDLTVCAVSGSFPVGTTVAVDVVGMAGTALSQTTLADQTCVTFAGLERWHADSIPWRARATIGDVTTSIGMSLAITDTRAFIMLSGPGYVLSTQSGANATNFPEPHTVKPATFSGAVNNAEAAAAVRLEVLQPGGEQWVALRSWTRPDRSPLVHAVPAWIPGAWHIRMAIEHYDGVVTYSNTVLTQAVRQTIVATASDYAPIVTYPTTLTASMNRAPATWPNTPRGWYYSSGGGPWVRWTTANPHVWASVDTPHRFVWGESFPDGSVIWSNTITVDARAITHWHETISPGANIQAAVNAASEWHRRFKPVPVNFDVEVDHACVVLAPGTYYLNTPLNMRRGVRLVANGAVIVAGPGINNAAMVRVSNNGGGRYSSPDTDWQIIGGDWRCQDGGVNSRGFSIVHTNRFRLHGLTIRNVRPGSGYAYIQATGCGGYYSKGTWNVQIIGCRLFRDTGKPSNAAVDDMAIRIESAWHSTGGAPVAFNCTNDGTVTNNILIQGNEIYNVTRAIGSTNYSRNVAGGHWPAGFHSGIRIIGNHFHDIGPDRWGGSERWASEGTVRPYAWWDAWIGENTFNRCWRGVSAWVGEDAKGGPHGNPGMIYVIRNAFNNQVARQTAIFAATSDSSGKKWHGILVEHNTLGGSWPAKSPGDGAEAADGYFIGIDDTGGTLPASSHSAVYRYNQFAPTSHTVSQEKSYNKYRGENNTHKPGIYIKYNTVSNGETDNS